MEEHFNTLDHQDWKTIVVHKPKENVKSSKKKLIMIIKKKFVEKKAEEGDLKQKENYFRTPTRYYESKNC